MPLNIPTHYPEPKMASKMGEGGQIWLKCTTMDLIMTIRYKNNIFERVKKNHAEMAWNYPNNQWVTRVANDQTRVR